MNELALRKPAEESSRGEPARGEGRLELILYPAVVALLVGTMVSGRLFRFGPRPSVEELKQQVLSCCDGPWGADSPAPCELATRGGEGTRALVDLLLSGPVSARSDVRSKVAYELVKVGEPAAPILLGAFDTADGEAKVGIARAFHNIAVDLRDWGQSFGKPKFGRKPGEQLPKYLPPLEGPIASRKALLLLEKGIRCEDYDASEFCARTLGNIAGPEAVGILVRQLRGRYGFAVMYGFLELLKSEECVFQRYDDPDEWEAYVKRMEEWYEKEYLPAMERDGFIRR